MGNVCNKVTTPCDHSFCNSCLTSWLMNKNSCPMCRFKIGIGLDSDSDDESDDDRLIIDEEFEGGMNEGYVHKVVDYIEDFEIDMYDLVDNYEDSNWIKDNKVRVRYGTYRMIVDIEERKKIVSAHITYTPERNHVKMIYGMKYIYHKHKQRRVKKLSKYCNNRKF